MKIIKINLISIFLISFLALVPSFLIAQKAFPTAIGAGAYTTGGRGGIVVHVTNLNDSGAGSFREAMNMEVPRTIVFDVSGIIVLDGLIGLGQANSNLTIAGQTAPEGGITIIGDRIYMANTDNIIVRHIRLKDSPASKDALTATSSVTNHIWDHCTFSFGNDEAASWYQANTGGDSDTEVTNITVQRCLFSENPKASIMGAENSTPPSYITVAFNAFYNTGYRVPNVTGTGQFDVINNVTWTVSNRLMRGNESMDLNHIGNYYDYGNRGIAPKRTNLWRLVGGDAEPSIYNSDNKFIVVSGGMNPSVTDMNANNDLMWGQFQDGEGGLYGDRLPSSYFANNQFPLLGEPFAILTADEAFANVIADVGCNTRLNADGSSSDNLDVLDADAISQMTQGNYVDKLQGGDRVPPAITSISRDGNFYLNNENIPEVWFAANVPIGEDHNGIAPSGYTWLEQYLNQIDVGSVVSIGAEGVAVTPITATLNVPETIVLETIFTPANTTNKNGVWTSSNESVATVSANGIVTSIAAGTAIITFTSNDGGFTDEAEITVTNIAIPLESVSISPNSATLDLNENLQLTAQFLPTNTTDVSGNWISSDENIVIVNNNGLISSVNAGQADITYTSDNSGLTASSSITVIDTFFGTYELYNAATDLLIQNIFGDADINMVDEGNEINFRSIPQGGDLNTEVESVRVDWTGPSAGTWTESGAIYAGLPNGHVGLNFESYVVEEGTYNFTVTYFSANAAAGDIVAVDDFSLTFIFDTALVANAGIDQSICEGETTTLTATGGTNFLWNTGETAASINVTPAQTTTYTVTVSNGQGEEDTATVTITVNEVPTANAGEDQTICEGETITLTATGGTSYLWNTGETSPSIEVNPIIETSYVVEVTSSNCSSTDSVTVFVVFAPNLNVSNNIVIVDGQSTTLIANGASNYLWSTGETTASISVVPTVTTTYTVSSIGANNCSISTDVTVTVIPEVIADAGTDTTICVEENVILNATGGGTYLWNTGETTSELIVSPSVTTIYTVTVEDDFGFIDTDSVTITVNETPNISISADVTIIDGDSTTLTANGGDNYQWITGETTASIVVNPSVTTTYTVSSFGAGDCEDTEQVTVTVIPELTANAGADASICSGDSITLNASGGISYTWNTGDTGSQLTVSPTVTTTYSVIAEDSFGNSDTDDVTITVNETPNVVISENITIVEGETTSLVVNGAETYEWNTGETANSITVSPIQTTTYTVIATANTCSIQLQVTVTVEGVFEASAGEDERVCQDDTYEVVLTANEGDSYLWNTGETMQSIIVSPVATSTYSVTVSQGVQEDTDNVTVYVDPNPDVVILNGDNVDIMDGDFITLSASGANSYEWNNGATQPNIAVSPSVTTIYEVRGYVGNCYDEKQITVNVIPDVIADAGQDVSICLDEVATLIASGGEEYVWSTGETTQTIEVSPSVTTEYTVTVFNALDFDEDAVIVEVDTDCDEDSVEEPIDDDLQDFAFDIFPNPASNVINLKLSGSNILTNVYLYDITGKLIHKARISNENMSNSSITQIDINKLQSGIYYIKLIDIHRDISKKLIVN
jgi:uncharacterized protein YjdB